MTPRGNGTNALEHRREERTISGNHNALTEDLQTGEIGQEVPTASEAARKLALAIASAGLDKKAAGIEIIDVCDKVDYTQLLVLMSGRSDRHVHAIAKGVQEDLKAKHGQLPLSVEGLTAATWVLLDFNDVVVHVFQQEARLYYDLEGLWIDASRVAVPSPPERGRSEPSPSSE